MGALFKDKKLLLGCLRGEPGPAGPAGMKLEKMEFIGQDADGGNIYEMTFSDGTKSQIVAPKGASVNLDGYTKTEDLTSGKVIPYQAKKAQTAGTASAATTAERDTQGGIIHEKYAMKAELSVYAKTEDLNAYATDTELQAVKEELQTKIDEIDLSGYAKTEELSNYATKEDLESAGGTVEVDGVSIVKGENGLQLAQKYIDYLESVLYAVPSISTFTLKDSKTYYEIGEGIAVSEFTHKETNTTSIKGNLTLFIDDSAVNENVTPSSSGAKVKIDTTVTKDTPTSFDYKLEGTSTKGSTFSQKKTVYVVAPFFIGGNTNTSVNAGDIPNLTKQALKSNLAGDYSVTLEVNGYIYFCCHQWQSIKEIKSGIFPVPLEDPKTVTGVDINGVSLSYKVYRTSNEIAAGTYSFTIA